MPSVNMSAEGLHRGARGVMRAVAGLLLVVLLAAVMHMDAHAQDLERATVEHLLSIKITTATGPSDGLGGAPRRVAVGFAQRLRQKPGNDV